MKKQIKIMHLLFQSPELDIYRIEVLWQQLKLKDLEFLETRVSQNP